MSFAELANAPISDLKQRDPVVVEASTTLGEIVTALADQNRGSVLVTDGEGKLIGIFTEHNMVRNVDLSGDWQSQPVEAHMTRNVQTAIPHTSLTTALLKMTAGRFRHLPIVDKDGKPMGIVSIRDIISHIAYCYPKEFVNLPPSPGHEPTGEWGG